MQRTTSSRAQRQMRTFSQVSSEASSGVHDHAEGTFRRAALGADVDTRPSLHHLCKRPANRSRASSERLDGVTRPELDYVAATIRLRPPRLAVLVPELPRWEQAVLFALARCEQRWGGAGAILIPCQSDVDFGLWIRLSVAFDPDHVLMLHRTLGEQFVLDPGTARPTIDGLPATDEQLPMLAGHRFPPAPIEQQAVMRIAHAASPFWSRLLDDGDQEPHLQLRYLDESGSRDLPVSETDSGPGTAGAAWTLVDKEADTEVTARVWLASRIGPSAARRWLDSKEFDAEALTAFAAEALELTKYNPWGEPGLWGSCTLGINTLLPWTGRDKRWVVVGDTRDDFLLAHALSRSAHDAFWIPASWVGKDSLGRSAARTIASTALTRTSGEPLRVASASLGAATARTMLVELLGGWIGDDDRIKEMSLEQVPERGSYTLVAIQQEHERSLALAVHVSNVGDRALVTRLPAQVPADLSVHSVAPHGWIIDVEASGWNIPRARSLPASNLQLNEVWRERVRDGRDGLSVMAASFGFVHAGASVQSGTAQPKLTFPGLETWSKSLAGRAGFELRRSDAGYQADLVAKLAGTRRALGDLLKGRAAFFDAFLTNADRSSDRYPDDMGCVIRGDGYPRFEYLRDVASKTDESTTRKLLDDLALRGMVSRGLIVRCLLCSHVQHTTKLDAVACGSCARCSEPLKLTRESWKHPIAEPHWYYDLHPLVRRVLRAHGDVPLLAEARLREQRGQLEGVSEFELVRDGVTLEIDLLCADQERVVVGEAKLDAKVRNAELRKKTQSLIVAAEVFKADEVLFASASETQWSADQQTLVANLIRAHTWPRGRAPELAFMSDLRD